jgi:hypothetical protein
MLGMILNLFTSFSEAYTVANKGTSSKMIRVGKKTNQFD